MRQRGREVEETGREGRKRQKGSERGRERGRERETMNRIQCCSYN